MSSKDPITFYDIASNQPLRTFAPNPWKTRYALNFKGISYQTKWVQLPDITAVREELGVPANRTLPDGTPYHTLPVIHDPSTGKLLGDSFEIALYLERIHPDGPSLFRPLSIGLTAAFNAHVDGVFTPFASLCGEMPFDPSVVEEIKAIFGKRLGVASSDDLQVSAEQREATFRSFEAKLGELEKAYWHTGGTTDHVWRTGGTDKTQSQRPGREQAGPFLDGDSPAYADFIVGSWLKMCECSMASTEWQRVRSWQDGLWGRVVDALDEWAEIQ